MTMVNVSKAVANLCSIMEILPECFLFLVKYAVFVVLCMTSALWAQGPASSKSYIARLERAKPGENVCVLVADSGDYLLERWSEERLLVFGGVLADSNLQQFRAMLDSHQIKDFSQQDIRSQLVNDTLNQFAISVQRTYGWQNLIFNDAKSRKEYPVVEELSKWLNSAERNKKLSRKNGATQTHCNPPATEPAVSPNDMAKTQSIQVAPAPPELFTRTSNPFVVSMSTEHMFRSSAERTCFIVYRGGQYHVVTAHQTYGADVKERVLEGTLTESQQNNLRTILDDTEIKGLDHQNFPKAIVFREATITNLQIMRGSSVQQLSFASYFNVHGNMYEIGGKNNLKYGVDEKEHVIAPIRKWFSDSVENKGNSVPIVSNTNCLP